MRSPRIMTPTPDSTRTQQAAAASDPQGINGPALRRWIARTQGIDPQDVGFSVLSVGRSNLPFVVPLAGAPRWVLRRPTLRHQGGSAHDGPREGRSMAALGPTDVHVPTFAEL